jgi:hypothetical protein
MKLPVAIAALFLATTTALPAFAATVANPAPNDIPRASTDTVQYRQAQTPHRAYRDGYVYRRGYRAYAAAPGYRVMPRQGCVSGLDRGTASAYPSWDLCSGR